MNVPRSSPNRSNSNNRGPLELVVSSRITHAVPARNSVAVALRQSEGGTPSRRASSISRTARGGTRPGRGYSASVIGSTRTSRCLSASEASAHSSRDAAGQPAIWEQLLARRRAAPALETSTIARARSAAQVGLPSLVRDDTEWLARGLRALGCGPDTSRKCPRTRAEQPRGANDQPTRVGRGNRFFARQLARRRTD